MISLSQWPTTTVDSFFRHFPWQGAVLETFHASLPKPEIDWRVETVQAFFTQIPWQGPIHDAQSPPEEQVLSYRLPVRAFFQQILWQGRPDIGTVPELKLIHDEMDPLYLEDLADLF